MLLACRMPTGPPALPPHADRAGCEPIGRLAFPMNGKGGPWSHSDPPHCMHAGAGVRDVPCPGPRALMFAMTRQAAAQSALCCGCAMRMHAGAGIRNVPRPEPRALMPELRRLIIYERPLLARLHPRSPPCVGPCKQHMLCTACAGGALHVQGHCMCRRGTASTWPRAPCMCGHMHAACATGVPAWTCALMHCWSVYVCVPACGRARITPICFLSLCGSDAIQRTTD